MSLLKLSSAIAIVQGNVVNANEYDPVDLFSGDAGRVRKALHALLESPQNNMRVLINGEQVASDYSEASKPDLLAVASALFPQVHGMLSTPDAAELVVDVLAVRSDVFEVASCSQSAPWTRYVDTPLGRLDVANATCPHNTIHAQQRTYGPVDA
jgi:hypothetical protein